MTDNDIDITGIGKAMEAVPDDVWKQVSTLACDSLRQFLSPLTSLAGGVGRLVEAKFDKLIDAEKLLAAETLKSASKKITNSGKQVSNEFKPKIILDVVDSSSKETEFELRELWANLLAQELTQGSVHPHIPRLLSQMTTSDARTLTKINRINRKGYAINRNL